MGAFIICTGNYWLAEIVHLPLYLCMTWYESIPSPYPWFCICIHIHLLEYQIPPRRVFSAMDLGNREPYHRSAGGKMTGEKSKNKKTPKTHET